MPNINILVIPHASQRYNTVGDYWVDSEGVTQIRISDLSDPFYENLILVHELTELTLCRKEGITDEMIDEFDFAFANSRASGDASEPGDDLAAPYYEQHQFATKVEKEMAEKLGVDWETYEARIKEVMATYL